MYNQQEVVSRSSRFKLTKSDWINFDTKVENLNLKEYNKKFFRQEDFYFKSNSNKVTIRLRKQIEYANNDYKEIINYNFYGIKHSENKPCLVTPKNSLGCLKIEKLELPIPDENSYKIFLDFFEHCTKKEIIISKNRKIYICENTIIFLDKLKTKNVDNKYFVHIQKKKNDFIDNFQQQQQTAINKITKEIELISDESEICSFIKKLDLLDKKNESLSYRQLLLMNNETTVENLNDLNNIDEMYLINNVFE